MSQRQRPTGLHTGALPDWSSTPMRAICRDKGEVMANARSTITPPRTVGTFLRFGTCSETLCNVLDRAFAYPMDIEEHASGPLAGGIMSRGYQCGQVWGSALAAGAEAFRRLGPGPQAEAAAVVAAQRIVDSFGERYHSIDCRAITDTDFGEASAKVVARYFLKNGVKCFRMAAQYAPVAFGEIDAALSEKRPKSPSVPVSCAAVVAQRLGASDMHAVMAAGFAGGIGLCGDACGALGAAIWFMDMNDRGRRADRVGYKNPRIPALVERFTACSGSRFLCADIVGRRFESIDDHASHLRDGGCAAIIDVVTAAQ